MGSMMQFEGKVGSKGVQLVAYLTEKYIEQIKDDNGVVTLEYSSERDVEVIGETRHPVLYTFWRKPCDQMGAWTGFRYNGEVHFPDMSIPVRIQKLPRDAVRVGDQAALRYWLDNGEHPIAVALKAAVKEANGN